MSAGLRWSMLACAALLLAIAALFYRLDAKLLHQDITNRLDDAIGVRLQASQVEVSLLHGISLKFGNVTTNRTPAIFHAETVYADIALLPLLLGKIEINAIHVHTPRIELPDHQTAGNTISMLSRLSLARFHIINGSISDVNGKSLLDDVQFDLRDLDPNRELRWEMLAHIDDRPVSSHGKLQLRQGNIVKGFGKLKIDYIPLSRFMRYLPAEISNRESWLPPLLGSAITLDISKGNVWSAFGEVSLATGYEDEKPIILRGKINHNADGELAWKDSFIHIGDKATLATEGDCNRMLKCEAELRGEGLSIASLLAYAPPGNTLQDDIHGMVDLTALLRWQQEHWQGEMDTTWRNITWTTGKSRLSVPTIQLASSRIGGDMQGNLTISDGQLSASGKPGGAQIQVTHHTASGWTADIQMDQFEAAWAPLANIALAAKQLPPTLRGSGPISGNIQINHGVRNNSIHFSGNAGQASIIYGTQFKKPAGVPLNVTGKLHWNNAGLKLDLESSRLSNSHLSHIVWENSWGKGHGRHSLHMDDAQIHFDDLRRQSVKLPDTVSRMRGSVTGQASTYWTASAAETATGWLAHLSADAELHGLGTPEQYYSGHASILNGRFSSNNMLWSGSYGRARLKGSFDLAKQTGRIAIHDAELDWDSLGAFPDAWAGFNINGSIDHAKLRLLHNEWGHIQADYQLRNAQLHIRNVRAKIAEGTLRSKAVQFTFRPEGATFSGILKAGGLKLQQLQGLDKLMLAHMEGRLYANVQLEGLLPSHRFSDWRGNGDIMIYQGKWEPDDNLMHSLGRLVIADKLYRKHAFREFGLRFRSREKHLVFSNLQLRREGLEIKGHGTVSNEGHITGKAFATSPETGRKAYRLSGILPAIRWSETPTSRD